MRFTIIVTNPDGSSTCLCETHKHQARVENRYHDAENPQHDEVTSSCQDKNDEIAVSKDESEEKEGTKWKDQDVDALRYSLPPTEIHDGLLFRKVG
jgi:archaellum component FlaD/FlaE